MTGREVIYFGLPLTSICIGIPSCLLNRKLMITRLYMINEIVKGVPSIVYQIEEFFRFSRRIPIVWFLHSVSHHYIEKTNICDTDKNINEKQPKSERPAIKCCSNKYCKLQCRSPNKILLDVPIY